MSNWENFGGNYGPRTPLPAGKYAMKMDNASMTFDQNAVGRTEVVFKVVEGEHSGRLVWFDWPHTVDDNGRAPFAWAARMMWDACGFVGQPEGEGPRHWFPAIAQALTQCIGRVLEVQTDVRSYQHNGETKHKARVKRVEAFTAQPEAAAPVGEAPQW